VGTTILPKSCGSEFKEYVEDLPAPADAAFAGVYATGHGDAVVTVDRVSFRY
jgi:hypothetical protein